jgi:hypothetical protein
MKEIILAFNQRDYRKACDILKKTGNEAINDVINAANYKDVDISSAGFIKALESKNPLDYDSMGSDSMCLSASGKRHPKILQR